MPRKTPAQKAHEEAEQKMWTETAIATWKAYEKAVDAAWKADRATKAADKAYEEAKAARKAYDEAVAAAWKDH